MPMRVKLPRARTLGVLLTLLAFGLLPAHGVLHQHHESPGACGHEESGSLFVDPADSAGPCTLCLQLISGVTLAGLTHAEEPESQLTWLACESDVDRRDSLRTRASVRGPPHS